MTLSVAIISQFKSSFLEKCLKSIINQTIIPRTVILVLHPDDRKSKTLINHFKKIHLQVSYLDLRGWAPLRNLALKENSSDLLYFVDDDCILDKNAVRQALIFFRKNSRYSAVQGKTENFNTSFYSQFAAWTNNLWLERLYDKKSKTLKSIDTKNVCFKRKAVQKYKFTECLGSEDVDFGLQISQNGGKIGFEPKMLVFHHEQANDFLSYLKKRLRMAKGLGIVKKKWGNLPVFYEDKKTYVKKILTLYKKSKYFSSLKCRIVFNILLSLRQLRNFLEKY